MFETVDLALLAVQRTGAVFARRGGQPISVETFLRDVSALAMQLPRLGHVVNLCRDRYRFAIGFAASLCREQVSLLPPNDTANVLEQLAQDYPAVYCLTDAAPPATSLPSFCYPPALDGGAAVLPRFPSGQPAAVLFTSGSTGRPQPHARTWGALVYSTRATGRRLGIAALEGGSLIGTVPHQHSYGLEALVMLALQHGLVLHAERPYFPADIRALLAEAPRPRLLVTTPVHLRALLAEPGALPTVDFVLSATAPLSPYLAGEAEARFSAPLYEIYGCSEAGQIAVRRTSAGAEWRCLEGIVLDQDAAGTWASGEPIAVKTLLADAIELRDSERFLLHGRLGDVVNIAGKRTSLAHLNHHLNAIPGVRDGVFVAPPDFDTQNNNMGNVGRLMAFVVAPDLGTDAILGQLRLSIDAAFLPRPLYRVAELPRNALGKLPHDAIAGLIAQARGK